MCSSTTPATKHCGGCGETKPASGFSKDRSKKDGLCSQCKTCRAEYRASPTGRIALCKADRKRRGTPARYETNRKAQRRYAATPAARAQHRVKQSRRRASKSSATPPWESKESLKDFERSRWIFAALMGVDESEVHLDHRIPLRASRIIDGQRVRVASGLHTVSNFTWKLGRENCAKGSSLAMAEAELAEPPTYERIDCAAGQTARGVPKRPASGHAAGEHQLT